MRPALRRIARARVLHPWAIGGFPVVSLWSQNLGKVSARDVAGPLAVVLAVTTVLYLLFRVLLADRMRAALATSSMSVFVMSFGHLESVLGAWPPVDGAGGEAALLATWSLALALAMIAVVRAGERRVEATRAANRTALVLLLLAAVPVARFEVSRAGSERPRRSVPALALPSGQSVQGRDVYYLVFDRYAGDATLGEVFGHENEPFWAALRSRGFLVLDRSRANYPKTAHSLAATLNMDYVHDLLAGQSPDASDWGPLYGLLDDHQVGRSFRSLGYEYVHVGTWWEPTARSSIADVNHAFDALSEFARVLYETTAFNAIAAQFGVAESVLDERRLEYERVRWQFDKIASAGRGNRPRFVFAHLTVPHPPYLFDRDGTFVSEDEERRRLREEMYVEQLEYVNAQILSVLDTIVRPAAGRDPIVILQSDEGPDPRRKEDHGPAFDWRDASSGELREKFGVLNAIRFPAVTGQVPSTLSPVNTFRLLFNLYFGADLPLLADRSYVFGDEALLYDFTDVTRRVR